MPKIKTHTFNLESAAGDSITFTSDIFVDSNGVFAVVVPEEYQLDIQANLTSGCKLTRPRKYWRVESKSLDDALASVIEGLRSVLETEITHELIIRYKYDTQCHYAKHVANGTIYSNCAQGMEENGQFSDVGGRIVDWVINGADRFGRSEHPYSISIQAQVLRKTTHKGRNSERIEYFHTTRAYNGDEFNGEKPTLGVYGTKLNGFNHTNLDHGDEEVPYTEDAAKFFHDAMLSICALSDRLSTFFADKENVTSAIESNQNLLEKR